MNSLEKKLFAEFLGTFLLITVGCGTALFAMPFVGYIGVAFTFGLTVLALYSIFEKTSGCHINPAVSFGFFIANKIDFKTFLSYVLAQLIGGLMAASLLLIVFKSLMHTANINTFVTNGYSQLSPGHFGFHGAMLVEILATFILVLVYLEATVNKNMTALALGAAVVAAHFFALPVTGASLNPARSFGVAVIASGEALKQVWFFFVMPMVGAVLASLVHKLLNR
jgi:aquaporin Z